MYNLSKSIRSLMVFALFFGLLTATENRGEVGGENVKSLFEVKYKAWREWLRQNSPRTPSSIIYMDEIYGNEPFREIVKLGIPAIAYIVEKQQEDHMLGHALYRITKFKWHERRDGKAPKEWVWTVEEFPDISRKGAPPDSGKIWRRWWKEGRKHTEQRFARLYEKRKTLKKEKKDKDAKLVYKQMLDLGIAALPYLIARVKHGDTELIAAISKLTDGELQKTATQTEAIDWWNKNKQKWLIPFEKAKSAYRTQSGN